MYPHSLGNIYPTIAESATNASVVEVHLQAAYPVFDICMYCGFHITLFQWLKTCPDPSVYPYALENIYPSVATEAPLMTCSSVVSIGVEWQYPIFDICEHH